MLQNLCLNVKYHFLVVMSRKANRRRVVRLNNMDSPKRSKFSRPLKSKTRDWRQRSVSPTRNRWRDDIRKMKSWRDASKGNLKEVHVELEEGIEQKTLFRTDKIVVNSQMTVSDIHENCSITNVHFRDEDRILSTTPSTEMSNRTSTTKQVFSGRDFFFKCVILQLSVNCSRDLLRRQIFLLGIQMELHVTRLRKLERKRRLLLRHREGLMVYLLRS